MKLRLGLSLLFLALLAACAPSAGTPASGPTASVAALEFGLVPDGATVTEFNPPGTGFNARVGVELLAHNSGDVPLTLRNVDWSFILEGRRVAGGTRIINDRVPAGGSLNVSLDIGVPLVDQPELLQAIGGAHTGTPVNFQLEVVAGYQQPDGTGRSERSRLNGSALAARSVAMPVLQLDSGLSGAFELQPGLPVVRLSVNVHNPGDIGYYLSGQDVQLSLAGVMLARQDLGLLPLAGGESRRVDLLFHPENPGPGALRVLSDAMAGQQVEVSVSGSLYMDVLGLGTFPLPAGVVLQGFLGN